MTRGPAKAAIMPPTPIQTISATLVAMSDQAMTTHSSMMATVATRLMFSTRRSSAAGLSAGLVRGTRVRL